jgi:hypothetical protein
MTHGLIGEPFEFIDLVFGWGDEFYPLFCHHLDCLAIFITGYNFQLIQMGL